MQLCFIDQGKINGFLLIAPKGVYKNWYEDQIPTHLPDLYKYKNSFMEIFR